MTGRARVLVTLEPRSPDDPPIIARSSPARKETDSALVHALEAHNATLKADNEKLEVQLAGGQRKSG
jgi:hypothetical protein